MSELCVHNVFDFRFFAGDATPLYFRPNALFPAIAIVMEKNDRVIKLAI